MYIKVEASGGKARYVMEVLKIRGIKFEIVEEENDNKEEVDKFKALNVK